jgi:hypothetical protein
MAVDTSVCDEHARRMESEPYRWDDDQLCIYIGEDLATEDWMVVSSIDLDGSADILVNVPGVDPNPCCVRLRCVDVTGSSLPDLTIFVNATDLEETAKVLRQWSRSGTPPLVTRVQVVRRHA